MLKKVWKTLTRAAGCWSEDNAMRLAAAVACYTIMSLAPLVVITMRIVTWIFGQEVATGQAQRQLVQLVGHAGAKAIQDMVKHSEQTGSGTLAAIVSFVILIFSASGVFVELQDSLNTIWEVKPRPDLGWWHTIQKRFFSMGMVFVIIFLLLVSMFITAALGGVIGNIVHHASGDHTLSLLATAFSYIFELILSIVVIGILFTGVFMVLPDVKLRFRDVWLGGLLTAILFKIGQYILAAYFNFGSTTSVYGAAGSLVAVLLWAYYSACILFFGAEFTQVYAKKFGAGIRPDQDAVPVTNEERAQQGIPRPAAVEASMHAMDRVTGRNRTHSWSRRAPSVSPEPSATSDPASSPRPRQPHIVTITRPTVDSRKSDALAGMGLLGGIILGAIGLLNGRRYTAGGLEQMRLAHRLKDLESRYADGSSLKRAGLEAKVSRRLDQMESSLRRASHELHRKG